MGSVDKMMIGRLKMQSVNASNLRPKNQSLKRSPDEASGNKVGFMKKIRMRDKLISINAMKSL